MARNRSRNGLHTVQGAQGGVHEQPSRFPACGDRNESLISISRPRPRMPSASSLHNRLIEQASLCSFEPSAKLVSFVPRGPQGQRTGPSSNNGSET
jgi:hypothetical protein